MSVLKGVKDKVWQSCTAELPTDKAKNLFVNFEVLFSKLPKAEYQALIDRCDGKDGRPTLADVLPEHMHDWKLKGEGGVDVPFDDDHIEMVFADLDYSNAVVEGFVELHVRKWKELTRKN